MIFIEHGHSPDHHVMVWQDRQTPIWKRIGGGCHLNRKVDDLIRAAGFQIKHEKNFFLRGPHAMTYTLSNRGRYPLASVSSDSDVARYLAVFSS